MYLLVLNFLFVNFCLAAPNSLPTKEQVQTAVTLSEMVYGDVSKMDNDEGEVFLMDLEKKENKSPFVLWRKRSTGDCYVVIRGTDNWRDWLTDANIASKSDPDLKVTVHAGTKNRGDHVISSIDEYYIDNWPKFKQCSNDIIMTGHSLGGGVALYVYLKYRYLFGEYWEGKSSMFKCVTFGAPRFVSDSSKSYVSNWGSYVYSYKYKRDLVPEVIQTVRNWTPVKLFSKIGDWTQTNILKRDLDKTTFGRYSWGNWCILDDKSGFDEKCNNYHFEVGDETTTEDHGIAKYRASLLFKREGNSVVSTILKGFEKSFDFINLNETNCVDRGELNQTVAERDISIFENETHYIIERLMDSETEVEYSICTEEGFTVLQCDGKCNCHEVEKNQRPNAFTFCTNDQPEGPGVCALDKEMVHVEKKSFYGYIYQTKIESYYVTDYVCNGKIYERGNYVRKTVPEESQSETEKSGSSSIMVCILMVVLMTFII